jgi:hypothetical protein
LNGWPKAAAAAAKIGDPTASVGQIAVGKPHPNTDGEAYGSVKWKGKALQIRLPVDLCWTALLSVPKEGIHFLPGWCPLPLASWRHPRQQTMPAIIVVVKRRKSQPIIPHFSPFYYAHLYI